MGEKYSGHREVPFYSQKTEFLVSEGSLERSQIVGWENNLCGLLCALMVLNTFSSSQHTVSELLAFAEKINAYDKKHGWIHDKVVDLLLNYGIEGERQSINDPQTIHSLLNEGNLIIASVSPRYLDSTLFSFFKRKKSGHLVLVIGISQMMMGNYQLTIHDPGSEITEGGSGLLADWKTFNNNFSGNTIVFKQPES